MNFPPLQPHSPSGSGRNNEEESGPIPSVGYQGPYVKYTHDDIVAIVRDVKDVQLPGCIQPVRV